MSRMAAVTPPSAQEELAATYAQRISAALPLMWARRVSMHDTHGVVRWQSEDVWGPAEREAVRLALEQFVGQAAPTRVDHDLPDQRTAVLLRASDLQNVFRGFVMLVVDSRRLRGKGKAAHDLPVPVLRAASDWAVRLASQPAAEASKELAPLQADRLLAFGPTVRETENDEFFARLRAFPLALVAQRLIPLQRGMRIRRYEVFLREESATLSNNAPLSLLQEADERGLGTVLDRRVAGMLVVWLSKRSEQFADEPAQFSVNLSGSSLADPNFLRFVELCLSKARIAPALIAFEVDQSYWRGERARFERLSDGIASMGAGLVIDNCSLEQGTAELLSLPGVRLVKIDRTLTRELHASKTAQMRIAGLAQMARVGGIHTVAKQVEDAEEQEQLRALGVDFVQGNASAPTTTFEELDLRRAEGLIIDENARERGGDPPGPA